MTWTSDQQSELLTIVSQRNERDVLRRQLDALNQELDQQLANQQALYDVLLEEEKDVDQLQRLSWAKLYYDLLSRREDQLTKEQAEAAAALSRYDDVKAVTTGLQMQVADIRQKLEAYVHVDTEYDARIEQKTGALLANQGSAYEQYKRHLEALTTADKQLQEVKEAHGAGLKASQEVVRLGKIIDEAKSWGTWDMLGGSSLTSIIKYQKLDEVREQSRQVSMALQRFRAEFADIHQTMEVDWQLDNNLARFTDIFFDNIFTDWSVQQQINRVRDDAFRLEERLATATQKLKEEVEQAMNTAQKRNEELRHFLESA
jgi:hypothetical protein